MKDNHMFIPQKLWRLRSGLLYAGIDKTGQAILTDEVNAVQFDERDNAEVKVRFYGTLLRCDFEVCAS